MALVNTLLLSLVAAASFLYFLYKKRKFRMSFLERCGIPGPTPHLFWGNMKQYFQMDNVLWDTQLIKEYGPIVGYYLGAKPFVLIADLDLLKLIESEKATNFLDRPRKVPGGINPDPHRAKMLGNLPVPEWKRVRNFLTPSFTPARLKEMTPKMVTLTNKMLAKVEKKAAAQEETDFYNLCQTLTLDIIGATAFAVDSNIQDNPEDPLLKAVMSEFAKSTNSILVKLYLCFPEISFFLHPLRKLYQKLKTFLGCTESSALWEHGRMALKRRRECNTQGQGVDILQKLVNSGLSDDQIVANCVLFFEAAYETLSGSLGFILHLLVKNLDVQEMVRQELEDYVEEYGTLDSFDIVGKLKYMDNVIKEGLRLFPPQTTFIGRSPQDDFQFEKDGHTYYLPKGTHIQAALVQIQNSSDYWTDVNEFQPDRHCENLGGDMKFQPFGVGLRKCIGDRFAILVLKLVLAKLLYNYQLVPCEKTEKVVTIKYKVATMTPMNGSWALPIPMGREVREN